jgi:hypothetical protein
MSSSLDDVMTGIRDVMTDDAFRAYVNEIGQWNDFCDAMDDIQDKSGPAQVEAVNLMSGFVGLPELATGSDLAERLTDIQKRLVLQRSQGLYKRIAEAPLSDLLPKDMDYYVGLVRAATGAPSDRATAGAGIVTLRPRIEQIEAGLKARGNPDASYFCEQALYILTRAEQFLSGVEYAPTERDLNVMTALLPHEIKSLRELTIEVDQGDQEIAAQAA